MNRKTYVLDTNVLLHDPDAIQKFRGNDVVVPMVVLEELDGFKKLTDELGKNARQVIRFLDDLIQQREGEVRRGIAIPGEINLQVTVESRNTDSKKFPLPLDRGSNKIVWAAAHLQDAGRKVVLVSKDTLVRVKAESLGIEAQDYESLKHSYDKMYRGYRKLEVTKRQIDEFYRDGRIALEVPPTIPGGAPGWMPNEYCMITSPENSSAVCRYDAKSAQMVPLLPLQKDIWGVLPMNFEQRCAMDLLLRDDIKLVTMIGRAGTGKTLLALAAGLRKVFDEGVYSRILVSRPIVPLGKDIGYLPGTKEEKLYHWMQPIYDNLEFLCHSSSNASVGEETQKWIMESKKIEMEAVTFIRGRSLPKIYMIIDEAQNLTPHELKTVISRAGQGTKVVLTGDPTQIDNPYLDKDSNALTFLVSKFKDQGVFGHVFLERTERSELAALAAEIL